jgi:hypothetical protein
MNEKVENLILGDLGVMRSDLSSVKEVVNGIRAEMRAMKQHMAAFMAHEATQDGGIASVRLQLERIGKRLDIVE